VAYIVRSFTPCFTLWFDVGICSLRDTSHNVYPTDVYPFSWVQLMSPLSLDLDGPVSAVSPGHETWKNDRRRRLPHCGALQTPR
jgi:hypothetical protein